MRQVDVPRRTPAEAFDPPKIPRSRPQDEPLGTGWHGLGQHQDKVFNYRGALVELSQTNSNIAVPLLLSTNGYGLLWNTASRSQLDDRFAREMKFSAGVAPGVD